MPYLTELDIANRALQHCRKNRIYSFADQSQAATEVAFAYDKLREAELRNNSWRFAIRRCPLRAIDTTTLVWTPPTYASGTTYSVGEVVVDSKGIWWQSKVGSNTGNTPQSGSSWQRYFGQDCFVPFDATAGISFLAGELTETGGVVYLSLINANLDTPPTSNWLAVNGTTTSLQILYPIGAGPFSNSLTKNAFRLPHGYLREAPQDPRAGINPYLGAPRGPFATDWVLEGDYIVSSDAGPLMLRFVADFVDVPDMDAMFKEMLAARIAEEVGPIIVEKDVLPLILAKVKEHYTSERWKAIAVNGIETGSEEPAEDDFITCRY